MSPADVAGLANVRALAALPGARFVTVRGQSGTVKISTQDIVGKSDNDLLAFIAAQFAEQHPDIPKAP